jgi:hypothetical protein
MLRLANRWISSLVDSVGISRRVEEKGGDFRIRRKMERSGPGRVFNGDIWVKDGDLNKGPFTRQILECDLILPQPWHQEF